MSEYKVYIIIIMLSYSHIIMQQNSSEGKDQSITILGKGWWEKRQHNASACCVYVCSSMTELFSMLAPDRRRVMDLSTHPEPTVRGFNLHQ